MKVEFSSKRDPLVQIDRKTSCYFYFRIAVLVLGNIFKFHWFGASYKQLNICNTFCLIARDVKRFPMFFKTINICYDIKNVDGSVPLKPEVELYAEIPFSGLHFL